MQFEWNNQKLAKNFQAEATSVFKDDNALTVFDAHQSIYMKDNYDFSKGKRGAIVPISPQQINVKLTIYKEIIDWFQSKVNQLGGGNYHELINRVLKDYIQQEIQDKTSSSLSCPNSTSS